MISAKLKHTKRQGYLLTFVLSLSDSVVLNFSLKPMDFLKLNCILQFENQVCSWTVAYITKMANADIWLK